MWSSRKAKKECGRIKQYKMSNQMLKEGLKLINECAYLLFAVEGLNE